MATKPVDLFGKHKPDLVLMDLRMPVKDGIEATIEIRGQDPQARVLMLTTFDGDTDIHKALQAGAQGYVLKNATGQELIPAIQAVAAGQRWIPKEIAKRLASRKLFEESDASRGESSATPRQRFGEQTNCRQAQHYRVHCKRPFEERLWQTSGGGSNRSRHRGHSARHYSFIAASRRVAGRAEAPSCVGFNAHRTLGGCC